MQYYSWIGKSVFFLDEPIPQEDVTKGNLSGLRVPLYDETYDTVSDMEQVTLYRIPLEYEMPENTRLQALIGFHQDVLCMTAVHVEYLPYGPAGRTKPLDVDKADLWKEARE